MREQSATRQQLETSIRALLPSKEEIDDLTPVEELDRGDRRLRGHHDRLRLGPLPRTSGAQEESVLIRKRLFGFATASALAKAWEKKSKTWLSFAGVLVLFQMLRLALRAKVRRPKNRPNELRRLEGRRAGHADRRQGPPLPHHLARGRRVPHPRRHRPARRRHRRARGFAHSRQHRAEFPGATTDAVGRGVEDAARRAGDLPQGPRDDTHAGRRRSGHARARGRRRIRRALDDVAARGRTASPATRSARTSRRRRRRTCTTCSAPTSPTTCRSAT